MALPRIVLANEFGAGRGHLVTLRQLARAFGEGFVFDAALGRREHDDVMLGLGADVYDGPLLHSRNKRRIGPEAVRTATWGEFLGDLGFDREERLRDVLVWWRHVIQSRGIAMVVADYAPLALLAARSLGVPSLATGTGYGLPPWHMPVFPTLNPENNTRLHDEAELLANVNRVMAGFGHPPLRGLPEVYRADKTLVRTLPFLDPYRQWRDDDYLPPVTDISPVVADAGDEVFFYFSTRELENDAIVEAVAQLPLPRRAYIPAPPPGVAERLAQSGMILEPGPVPVRLIAERSRLIVNSGQHGILSLGLFSGLPQICLPQHQEQMWHARAAERKGVARVLLKSEVNSAFLAEAIRSAYDDPQMFRRAQDFAKSLKAGLQGDPQEVIARMIAPMIAALRG